MKKTVARDPKKVKQCPRCHCWKTLDEFARDYHSPDHRRTRCIKCNSKREKKRGELWQTTYADERGAEFTKLRYGRKGMSVAEIAEQEGISRQAVHQSIVRYVRRHGMKHLLEIDAEPAEAETPTIIPKRRERRVAYEPPDIPTGTIFQRYRDD